MCSARDILWPRLPRLLGSQGEALSGGKEVNGANLAGSKGTEAVSTAVFHEGWENERWAVMLKWEEGK